MANVTDGSVVWAVKTINDFLPLSGGVIAGRVGFYKGGEIRNSGDVGRYALTIFSEKNNFKRSLLHLSTADAETQRFALQAGDGTNAIELQGKVDGSLTWNGKSILRQEYFSTSEHSNHSCVLKLGNVLIMAGQVQASSASTAHTIKFPQAFLNNNTYGAVVTPYAGDGASRKCTITNQGKDFISVAVDVAVSWLFYVAIGQYK